MGQTVPEQEDVLDWAEGLQALHRRIAGRFGRVSLGKEFWLT